MTSGRTDKEIVADLETYYNQLCDTFDREVLKLREEYEITQAEDRTQVAEELVIPQNDLDNLGNFFLECVYHQRKALRQKLIKMKFTTSDGEETDPKNNKLLETYMKIVKTGAPEEIEQFSKIERQKLVELLSTNQDLLNFIFDKMFINVNKDEHKTDKQEDTEPSSGEIAQMQAMNMNQYKGQYTETEMNTGMPLISNTNLAQKYGAFHDGSAIVGPGTLNLAQH